MPNETHPAHGARPRLSRLALLALIVAAPLHAGTPLSFTIDCDAVVGPINPLVLGAGGPDKYNWWAGDSTLTTRISDAGIKLVRLSPVQLGNYNGRDMYPYTNTWNWTDMDALVETVFDAGAQPLFQFTGFPGGVPHTLDGSNNVTSADWAAYADFAEAVVDRYNVQKVLGSTRTITYWELWNEPTIEGDGKLTQAQYKTFVETVGAAMKAKDSAIKIVAAVDAWSDFSSTGFLSYTAKNLAAHVDILSWHDYGPAPTESDANRMAWTAGHYHDNVLTAKAGASGNLQGPAPGNKLFGAAITEFNMSHQDGGSTYNLKYHNEFNATFLGSALLQAATAGVELFTVYNLRETGANLLGLLDSSYNPYKPYYTYRLFGNHLGDQRLAHTGGNSTLEILGTYRSSDGRYYVFVVNKHTSVTYDLTVTLDDVSNATGDIHVRTVGASTNGTSIDQTFAYSGSQFTRSVAPLTVTCFEVEPDPVTVLFSTGFESADPALTWSDSTDGLQNVSAYTWASIPECSPRQESPRTGAAALMFSGKDDSASVSYCKFKVFDVNIPISSSTKLGYAIRPGQDNARYVGVDLVCTDGATLRDSGAVDYNGQSMHPSAGHGGAITLNAYTQIKSNIGQWLSGKTIDRILVNYDRPGSTGDFRGFIDDLIITNGTLP